MSYFTKEYIVAAQMVFSPEVCKTPQSMSSFMYDTGIIPEVLYLLCPPYKYGGFAHGSYNKEEYQWLHSSTWSSTFSELVTSKESEVMSSPFGVARMFVNKWPNGMDCTKELEKCLEEDLDYTQVAIAYSVAGAINIDKWNGNLHVTYKPKDSPNDLYHVLHKSGADKKIEKVLLQKDFQSNENIVNDNGIDGELILGAIIFFLVFAYIAPLIVVEILKFFNKEDQNSFLKKIYSSVNSTVMSVYNKVKSIFVK